jgi:hypothetical protein
MAKNKEGKPLRCHICGYSWLTQSKMYFVPCPRCRRLVKVQDVKKITDDRIYNDKKEKE